MTDLDFDFDGFLADAASLIDRDKKHELDFKESLKNYSEDCEENGMSLNEMVDYCKNVSDIGDDAQLEAKEIIEDEDIEEINNHVSNEIIPSKEHIINMFSKEFVENIEKTMRLRVDQLKNTKYKFKFINIPTSFAEKSQEDFKQTFFKTPEMSGGSSHYSKSIERTANFGEAFSNLQPMQQAFQGMHKMTLMMTFESTTSSFGNQFNALMKNTFPAIECHNPHPSNQLERFQPLPIKPPPVVITISSSDEAPVPAKIKLDPESKKTKNTNKENQCANTQKSTKDPNVRNSSIKQTPIRVEKKLKRKERHRVRLPSESSDDDQNVPIQSRKPRDFVKRQRNSDVKKVVEVNDCSIAEFAIKDLKIVMMDCMKKQKLHNISDEFEKSNEPVDVLDEPVNVSEVSSSHNEDSGNPSVDPCILDVNLCNPNENPGNIIEAIGNPIENIGNFKEELDDENGNQTDDENGNQTDDENGNQTDDTISTITSDDEKFFFVEKYDLLRKQKLQMRLHEKSIRRGIYSDYKPETTITHPVASSTLITPQSDPVLRTDSSPLSTSIETTMSLPAACSTLIQLPPALVLPPRKSKSPFNSKKSAPKRQLPNNKPNISSKKIHIIYSSASDNESNSSVSTITSDDVKFFEKDKYDKLREEKHALRAALRAKRKKRK